MFSPEQTVRQGMWCSISYGSVVRVPFFSLGDFSLVCFQSFRRFPMGLGRPLWAVAAGGLGGA